MVLPLPLDRLQRWMQEVVAHPGTREEAVGSPAAQAAVPLERLSEVILPSRTLEPSARVGIYHGMYVLRMEEALATDYPGLKHLLGEQGFLDLVRGYVQEYPSRHFSLNRLGDHLPEYLLRAPGLKRRGFCRDLARLELAVSRVFDAPETPPLSEQAIATVPLAAWETVRLRPVAAFELHAFGHAVSAYLDSMSDEQHRHPPLRRKDTWVAVYRRDYAVWRQDLTRPAYHLLTDLVAGKPLGQAVEAAQRRGGRVRPSEDDLFRWFRQWTAGGIFMGLEGLEPSTNRL